jgi:hypothetical protein
MPENQSSILPDKIQYAEELDVLLWGKKKYNQHL